MKTEEKPKVDKKPRRTVILDTQQILTLVTDESPKELVKETVEILEAMPGITWAQAAGLAKYNIGKGGKKEN